MSRMRRLASLFVAVAASLALVAVDGPAQATVNFQQIPNYGTRKCMDLAAENDVFVQQWQCINGDVQQQWLETLLDPSTGNWTFTSQVNGTCLQVDGNSTAVGARITTGWCGAPSATWRIIYANNITSGWHQQLVNVNSGLCLDLHGNSPDDGTILWLWPCSDELHPYSSFPAQLWMLGG